MPAISTPLRIQLGGHSPTDLVRCEEIWKLFLPGGYNVPQYLERTNRAQTLGISRTPPGQVAGFVGFQIRQFNQTPHLDLEMLGVDPELQKQGIASQLVDTALQYAHDRQVRHIKLWAVDLKAKEFFTNRFYKRGITGKWGEVNDNDCIPFYGNLRSL